MDSNLEDTLTYDHSLGVDFSSHSDSVVNQSDITLEGSSQGNITMEYETMEGQQILMDTSNEDVIVPDLINNQFSLTSNSDYCITPSQTSELSALDTSQSSLLSTSQGDNMMDLQFETQTTLTTSNDVQIQPQLITIKPSQLREIASVPRQVAIAPKPPALKHYTLNKNVAIAPKPTTQVVINKAGQIVKKVSLGNLVPVSKGMRTVFGQGGKQLVVIPAGAQKKLKLVQSGGQPIQAQIIRNMGQAGKPTSAKVIVQNQQNSEAISNLPAVITKLKPVSASSSGASPTRYITVHQKTVPVSINSKMVISSPPKQAIRVAKPKQQIVTIKSPSSKIVPITTQVSGPPKKLVLTGSTGQNVVLKGSSFQKAQIVKSDGSLLNVSGVTSGQRTQLHQINVPGKGVQYIRLVTSSANSTTPKLAPKQTPVVSVQPKTILLADGKGNLIQMPSEKIITQQKIISQPPPLVVTSSNSKPANKPQQKLVRIAPVAKKTSSNTQIITSNNMSTVRAPQSLLAPIKSSPLSSPARDSLVEATADICNTIQRSGQYAQTSDEMPSCEETKNALRALVEETTRDLVSPPPHSGTVEIDFSRQDLLQGMCTDESTNSADVTDMNRPEEQHPLIVIPSFSQNNYETDSFVRQFKKESEDQEISFELSELLKSNMEPLQKSPQPVSDNELDFRPRKPCNCTKSQCLKLYCDCFANGEFCNNCNCNNCHNNLENEELRQKAIRGCLDRNPNAFRPKIGKAQTAGPEPIRRHNKGCNCKRSGCLKNYCECYEAKIACTSMCKCVGCRNVEESVERSRRPHPDRDTALFRHPPAAAPLKNPCNFMTMEVIEAVCQCLLAAAADGKVESGATDGAGSGADSGAESGAGGPRAVLDEFSRCLQDIIGAAHHPASITVGDEARV